MTILQYRDKDYDVDALKRIGSQGVPINVKREQLVLVKGVTPIKHDQILVVASGETYEVLACGFSDLTELKKDTIAVILLSKPVLKKAIYQEPAVAHRDYEDNLRGEIRQFQDSRGYPRRDDQRRYGSQGYGGYDNRQGQSRGYGNDANRSNDRPYGDRPHNVQPRDGQQGQYRPGGTMNKPKRFG
jgi:hypothetical protein